MKVTDVCNSCRKNRFDLDGVALVKGCKFFNCMICKDPSANYAEGQTNICHACCEKNYICTMCGGPINR
jgi:hypothetical protein